MLKNKLFICSCLILPIFAFADKAPLDLNILDNQQNAISNIQYNTNVTDSTSTGVTPRDDTNNAINSLEQALSHTKAGSSQHLQIQLSLFTLEVGEQDKTKSKQTIQNLVKEYPNDPIVQIYSTAYAFVLEFGDYRKSLDKLKQSTWEKMPHYVKSFDVIEKSFNLRVDTSANEMQINNNARPVIVVLGFALHSEGIMDSVLVERLKVALEAYKQYPNAQIIVSGGGVVAGVTEAYKMKQWLINHKVPAKQVTLEDKSISTVWNALNTTNLIKDLKPTVKDIILVTSDSHIRRAHAVFEQALENDNLPIKIHNLASATKDYNLSEPITNHEKSLIIKDTFRTAGIWQMPGMVL
ncbi:YdcF family protein [Francisellaceae bacterium CB300]